MAERKEIVAVVGAGGAESALVQKYSKSDHVKKIFAFPGNPMMKEVSEVPIEFINLKPEEGGKITRACHENEVTLIDIRNERGVKADIATYAKEFDIAVVGPDKEAGRLEDEKAHARIFASTLDIVQPTFNIVSDEKFVKALFANDQNETKFLKANGLADGKGVIKVENIDETLYAMNHLKQTFPDACDLFLLEDALIGEEFSSFAASDGKNYVMLGDAQDNKRLLDGDLGPNTGGMGAHSYPFVTQDRDIQRQIQTFFHQAFDKQNKSHNPYHGIMYLGGMVVLRDGQKKVAMVEINTRWGDPEGQITIPGLKVDFFEMGMAIHAGKLDQIKIEHDGNVRVAVAITAKGYPEDYRNILGKKISGIKKARAIDGVEIHGAGVMKQGEEYVVAGGRVAYVVGTGNNLTKAVDKAYQGAEIIGIEGGNSYYRRDIAKRDLVRLGHSGV